MARPRTRLTALTALVAGTALLVVGPATAASAHNVLRSTDPADGSTVTTVPTQVVLTFDQPALAMGTELVVTAPDGHDVADGHAVLVDSTVAQPVAGDLPAGTYTVQWRVTSADGHPISGSFRFTATAPTSRPAHDPAPANPAPTTTASPAPAAAAGGPPWNLVAAAVVALAVLAAAAWSWRRRARAPRARS